MKQLLLTTLVFLGCGILLHAERYFVQAEATGDGSSWEHAAADIQTILSIAVEGDEIWVARGVYFPTQEDSRFAHFSIPSGVKIYGGFAGTESELSERDLEQGTSVLSGEIGDTESKEDNSYTIVYFDKVDATTLIDGFTITSAYANGMVDGADVTSCGGGIFINAEMGESSPVITNCILESNFSREGAAIYTYSNEGLAQPIISDCTFDNNRSNFNGGAIYNDGNFGECKPTISNCLFTSNESMYGAAIFNRASYGDCQATITDCEFNLNLAAVRAIVYDNTEDRGKCVSTATNCSFADENVTTMGDFIEVGETLVAKQERKSSIRVRSSVIAY